MSASDSKTGIGTIPGRGKSTVAKAVCIVLAALGVVCFLVALGRDPARAWRAYLVNWLFFTGIGTGGILFVAALNTASGRWGRNLKRVAEGLGLFAPVSFVLFLTMIPGLDEILPWVRHPHGPTWWLDLDFLIVRNAIGLGLLSLIGVYLVRLSLKVDAGNVADAPARRRFVILSPIYAMAYAVVMTVIGVDLIMSLKEGWYSTLIGAYYFTGSFYVALAAILIGAIWARRRYGLHDRIGSKQLHDIAKLTMAFGVVTGDFFYTHLLVFWYGNLPWETGFLIERMGHGAWRTVGFLVLFFCFIWPLLAMLNRRLKERATPMVLFAAVVLTAMWMERFLLVGPSIPVGDASLLGLVEVGVTLGFAGLLGTVFLAFMDRVPPVVRRDPVLDLIEEGS